MWRGAPQLLTPSFWSDRAAHFFLSLLSMLFASLPRSFTRRFLPICAVMAATTAALFAQSPSAADGFDPNIDGNVYAMATQPDGKVLIAGQFANLRPNG